MDTLALAGRLAFAVGIAALGLQQLVVRDFVPGPFIAPAGLPARAVLALASGLALLAAPALLAIPGQVRRGALALGGLLMLLFAAFHLPSPGPILHDGVARTRALETLALGVGAWALTGPPLARPSVLVFAATLLVFGYQHHLYAPFVAAVIPKWLPGPMFWTYVTGVAFVLAGISLAAGRKARLAARLLGLMLLLFAVMLHLPRVFVEAATANELNSLFVALALGGASWAMAAVLPAD
jgi:uncharacterized membrane protein YphA (DoxX/SURF4 family)